jgi:hypothetical protein
VQLNAQVIYKGDLVLSLSQMYDDFVGCTWLVGIITSIAGKIICEIVKTRKIETIISFIPRHVKVGTFMHFRWGSFVSILCKNTFCNQEILNHSMVLKNATGYHTNNIENVWSQTKYEKNKTWH